MGISRIDTKKNTDRPDIEKNISRVDKKKELNIGRADRLDKSRADKEENIDIGKANGAKDTNGVDVEK